MPIHDPFIELFHFICNKVDSVGDVVSALNQNELAYFTVNALRNEVNNGGFEQFFFNSAGDLYRETLLGLKKIGASETLELLERASRIAFGTVLPPNNRQARWKLLDMLSTDSRAALAKLEDSFYKGLDRLDASLQRFATETKLVSPFISDFRH